MKKILKCLAAFVLALSMAKVSQSDTTTSRLGLTLPTIGSSTWGQKINNNFQILDATSTVVSGSLLVTTGTSSGYISITSSQTRTLVFDATQFRTSLINGNTVYVTMPNPTFSSATITSAVISTATITSASISTVTITSATIVNALTTTVAVASITINNQLIWPTGLPQKYGPLFLNPKDAPVPAKGDGITDDSTAIQYMLNFSSQIPGSTVWLTTGTYALGTRLTQYSSTTIMACSPGAVVFKALPALKTKMIVNQAWGGTGTDINLHIYGIIFDEAGSTHGASDDTSLTWARVDYSTIEKCKFINGTSGLFLLTGATYDDNHHDYFIDDVWDSSNLIAGGTDINDFGNGKDIQIIRPVFLGGFTNSGNVQISAAGMDDFVVRGGWFNGLGNGDPISVFGVHGGGIYECDISSSNGFGVRISHFNEGTPKRTMTDFNIVNNHIHGNGDNGIWLRQEFSSTDTIQGINISGNKIDFNRKSGIDIELGKNINIENNIFEGNSVASSGTYAVIQATGVAGTNTIFNVNVLGNQFFDNAATPSQTFLYQTNFVSTFTSNNNAAEKITTRSSILNTNGFYDLDSLGGFSVVGTKTNDNAPAGAFGEYISSSIANYQNVGTSSNYFDLAAVTLSSGDWDVSGACNWNQNGATILFTGCGIGTVAGNNSTGLIDGDTNTNALPPITTSDVGAIVAPVRKSLTGPTIIYLKGLLSYSVAVPRYKCRISARRMR